MKFIDFLALEVISCFLSSFSCKFFFDILSLAVMFCKNLDYGLDSFGEDWRDICFSSPENLSYWLEIILCKILL
jgi:hypothetical protein